jgi:hypothetical protein
MGVGEFLRASFIPILATNFTSMCELTKLTSALQTSSATNFVPVNQASLQVVLPSTPYQMVGLPSYQDATQRQTVVQQVGVAATAGLITRTMKSRRATSCDIVRPN